MKFDVPHFSFWSTAYTAVGAVLFWSLKGRTKLRVFALSDVVEKVISNPRLCYVVEFFLFVSIGCFVAVGVADPGNPRQAITAGLAWTGLLSSPDHRSRNRTEQAS
jgi:hypothetical protein